MISNPVSVFVTGNDWKEFTYEGGSQFFHFSPKDNGLSKYRDCNVAFFADDEDHALDVLRRMFQFVIDCNLAYNERYKDERNQHTNRASYLHDNDRTIARFEAWIKALDAGAIKVELVPTDQFFKIGWAGNDTI